MEYKDDIRNDGNSCFDNFDYLTNSKTIVRRPNVENWKKVYLEILYDIMSIMTHP